MKRDVINK